MKKEIIALGALCATVLFSVNAIAKPLARITLMNTSKTTKKIQLDYRVALQNRDGKIQLSAPKHISITLLSRITVDLKSHTWGGIIPTRINGHILPNRANKFGKQHTCSIAMDKKNLSGTLVFNLVSKPPKHGNLTCRRAGGTLI